ncbi:uncharacterized protein LOC116350381 [Contarinia nasturtii]|uniref:uncharacterized protein LOC116350381 n=1 Tax=Contarinia nasturtii TaxID=265458 RepID=UPI0012D42002|nr:uncharacterized protein LOC116350381 [Contarinia nasturtii]
MVDAGFVYEFVLYFNSFYVFFLVVVEISLFIIKMMYLKSKGDVLRDIGIMLSTLLLEAIRVHLGRKGLLSEHGWKAIISVIMIFPCMAGICYLIFMQGIKIRLEIFFCYVELLLQCVQLFYAALYTVTACQNRSYHQ